MKALIILAILVTLGIIVYKYKKDKNLKKLLITLATFATIMGLAIAGNLTRPVMPLFIAHEILILIAWGALVFMYVFKGKYCWWWFVAPLFTIGLFLVLEFIGGSAHELI
jgi:hypothetical protein